MARIDRIQTGHNEYMGLWDYSPNGFISERDEQAQALAQINPHLSVQHWANELCFQDKGDEEYNPNPYAYVPTNFQIVSAIEAYNRQSPNEGPTYNLEPGMNNLLQGIQQSIQNLLNNIRASTGTSQW